MGTTQGFWSYVHKDDTAMHGAIRGLAERVQQEYELLTGGAELDLFLDSARLKWGDKWRTEIKTALEGTTFFIPAITPRYFESEECRSELLGFADQAEQLGLEGLVMPLYFVDVPALETGDTSDPAIRLVANSQREDWRTLRFLDETTQPYRLAVHRLAARLLEVSRQRERKGSEAATAATPSEDEDEGRPPDHPSTKKEEPPASAVRANEDGPPSVREMGTLELLAEGEAAFPRITETLQAISSEISAVGDMATEATSEIEQSDQQGKGFKGRLVVVSRLAKRLAKPADRLEELTSQYTADLVILDPAITQLISLVGEQADESPNESKEFFSSVTGMVSSTRQAGEGIQAMITGLNGSSSISRELEPPLKQMRTSLQSMIDGQHMIESWEEHVAKAIKS